MVMRSRILSFIAAPFAMLAACGAQGSEADGFASTTGAGSVFANPGGGWRPLSPTFITFYHVEEDGTAGKAMKTYVRTADSNSVSRIFGNVLFDRSDPAVAGLLGYPSPISLLTVRGTLIRLHSFEAVATALDEQYARQATFYKDGPSKAEILLFPKLDQLTRYVGQMVGERMSYLGKPRQLTKGCFYVRGLGMGDSRESAVLAMHVPDDTVSLDDADDRACLDAFFAANIGTTPTAVDDLIFGPGSAPAK
jgi:hypothetical protein